MKRVAYIDASNLKFGVKQSGRKLNYKSFRSWLRDKFNVNEAIFIRDVLRVFFLFITPVYIIQKNCQYKNWVIISRS